MDSINVKSAGESVKCQSYSESFTQFMNFETVGQSPIEVFVDACYAFLKSDFKFDYITRCGDAHRLAFDFVAHKADLIVVIDNKFIMNLYSQAKESKPIIVMSLLRSHVIGMLNELLIAPRSILVDYESKSE